MNSEPEIKELTMKVFRGSKQVSREKTETIWDRFDRLHGLNRLLFLCT